MAVKKSKPEPAPEPVERASTAPLGDRLAAARAAAPDATRVLAALLDIYRTHPVDELADAIREVGARAERGRLAPSGKTGVELQRAWISAAAEGGPAVRGMLADSMIASKGCSETLERIEALAPHLPDPRISDRLVRMLESPPVNATAGRTSKFWTGLFALLPKLGDPRAYERVEALRAAWARDTTISPAETLALQTRLDKALPQIAGRLRLRSWNDEAASAALAEIVHAVASHVSDETVTEESLLAEVYADPVADEPRLVYADWLQQRSDPRGELIALQVSRQRGKVQRDAARREKALLAEFTDHFLGTLKGRVEKKTVEFERGFLDVCRPIDGLDADPAWSTLRVLVGALPKREHPQMPRLRALLDVSFSSLLELAHLPQPVDVEEVHCRFANSADDRRVFETTKALPRLKHLYISLFRFEVGPGFARDVEWLWTSPGGANLETLAVTVPGVAVDGLCEELEHSRVARLVIRLAPGGAGSPVQLVVERDDSGKLSCATFHVVAPHAGVVPQYVGGLGDLPRERLRTIRVVEGDAPREPDASSLRQVRAAIEALAGGAGRVAFTAVRRPQVVSPQGIPCWR